MNPAILLVLLLHAACSGPAPTAVDAPAPPPASHCPPHGTTQGPGCTLRPTPTESPRPTRVSPCLGTRPGTCVSVDTGTAAHTHTLDHPGFHTAAPVRRGISHHTYAPPHGNNYAFAPATTLFPTAALVQTPPRLRLSWRGITPAPELRPRSVRHHTVVNFHDL